MPHILELIAQEFQRFTRATVEAIYRMPNTRQEQEDWCMAHGLRS